ncbi:hypothetical protein BT96DRAFT_943934 [Gymnopus androsaceus JB14]|uniref:Uncharacterized protein n=1 Tax=Gymnopus androsaceus JB14 TaxID=1447944 RepID=A0A6A4H6N1_9AGAR|nr:hypothetical protein BT96DRAFT_943934 [Gymnopus androsaceus JB14]
MGHRNGQTNLYAFTLFLFKNDLISWLLDEAKGKRRNNIVYNIVLRILNINFAAIHTMSVLVQTLREEVETVVRELGWSKAAMGQMRKLDSFMKETQRLAGVGISMRRMALRDFKFSNGSVIPAGTTVDPQKDFESLRAELIPGDL